ncbi:MAG TPA: MBL fold metallo-hydrolase, partial [Bdellovibrionota bacterium]
YGPKHFEKTLKKIMDLQMDYAYFPVSMQQLNAKIEYSDLQETSVKIGETRIVTKYSNHPVTGICYKIICNGKTIVYSGDTEPYYNVLEADPKAKAEGKDFMDEFKAEGTEEDINKIVAERNALHQEFCASDILIHDAQYTEEEYVKFTGWGHSPMEGVIKMAKGAGVKRLVLNHHEPVHTDAFMAATEEKLKGANPGMDLFFSREGMELTL